MIGAKHVAVCMIVKNEESVIARCINSVSEFADLICVSDTGSTDGTLQKLGSMACNLPIQVRQDEWVSFEHNRNLALQFTIRAIKEEYVVLTDSLDDWVILHMDADDRFIRTPEQDLEVFPNTANSISLNYRLAELEYSRVSAISDPESWHWEGVVHEYLARDRRKQLISGVLLGGYVKASTSEGHRASNPDKYLLDAQTLEHALMTEPDNKRYQFYLARSYHDHWKSSLNPNHLAKALQAYKLRSTRDAYTDDIFEEERWYAEYMYAWLTGRLEDMQNVVTQRPWRADAALNLANLALREKRWGVAYIYAKLAVDNADNINQDLLFVDSSAYGWRAVDALAQAAYYAGFINAGRLACYRLLDAKSMGEPESHHLPDSERARVTVNLAYYLRMDNSSSAKSFILTTSPSAP